MNRTLAALGRTLLALGPLALASPAPAASPPKAPAKAAAPKPAGHPPAKTPAKTPAKAPGKDAAKPAPAKKKGPAWKDDDCILKAGAETLTYADFKKLYRTWSRDERPLEEFPAAEQMKVFRKIYHEKLLAAEARARGLQDTQVFRDRTLAARYRLLVPVLKKREYVEKIVPTDDELLQYIPPAQDSVQVRIIVKNDAAEARRVYERAVAGEDFEKLARAESAGNLRSAGGLSEFMSLASSKGKFPPPVVQKFLDAPLGKVLEPFYQDIGFLVVKVEAKHSADALRRGELARRRQEIVNKIHQTLYDEWLKKVAAAATVVVDDDAVKAYEQGGGDASAVVLRVNDEKFLASEIFGPMGKMSHGGQPMRQRAENFVETALAGQEAVKLGLDKDPLYLEKWGLEEQRALSQELIRVEVEPIDKAPVTDAEVEEYRKGRPEKFMDPEARRIRLLVVNDEEGAKSAIARLRKGDDFTALVKELSTDPISRGREGDMGYLFARDMPPPVAERVFKLKAGELTDPAIEAEASETKKPVWLVARLEGVRDPAPTPPDRVRTPKVENEIRTLKRSRHLKTLVSSTATKHGYAFCNPPATD